MPGLCVIGLQWGDEAKGKLVDWLAEGHDLIVRYQGGANAGHTVVVGDEVYKLHLIPSGIVHPGILNLVSAGVVIHPKTMLGEMDSLLERGVNIADRLKFSGRAHCVMPWHIKEDEIWNKVNSGDDNIGTTMRGIGPCYRDKVGRSFAIRMSDLLQPELEQQIRRITKYKIKSLAPFCDDGQVDLDAAKITEEYLGYAERLRPYIADTTRILLDAVDQDKGILFEGAQGSLLDVDFGTYPFVTSSNSSGVGVSSGTGVPGNWIGKTIGVAKCYSTRVGGGPFPTELHDETGEHIRVQGNEFGTTTGRPRRCGWFDAVAVRYTCRLSGADSICLTMLDVLSQLSEIHVCVAYELDGQRIEHFPENVSDIRRIKPIYETLPGWEQDITTARKLEDLPVNARAYAARLSELCQRPIEFISVGPDRVQTIVLNPDESLLDSSVV
ncbi:MAG: adenylosuccinate synthase [Mariniblastus sp.]|nr:adenylosuccinate synthase [Mariniblastus sp.]